MQKNREIMFRCWNSLTQKMYRGESLNCLLNEAWDTGHADSQERNGDEYDHLVWMQFTGIKDSFGKQIYEGDIVKCIANDDYPNNNIVSDVIFSHDLQWQVRSILEGLERDEVTHGLPLNWGGYISIEVTGNIYEHPHLLNMEQKLKRSVASKAKSR